MVRGQSGVEGKYMGISMIYLGAVPLCLQAST